MSLEVIWSLVFFFITFSWEDLLLLFPSLTTNIRLTSVQYKEFGISKLNCSPCRFILRWSRSAVLYNSNLNGGGGLICLSSVTNSRLPPILLPGAVRTAQAHLQKSLDTAKRKAIRFQNPPPQWLFFLSGGFKSKSLVSILSNFHIILWR